MADNNVLHSENNIETLFRDMLNYRTFWDRVNQILHNANSNTRIFTEESVDEVRGRFASPASKLSSLISQGGSSSNNSDTPVIQRNHSDAKIIFNIAKRKHKQELLISARYKLPTKIFPLSEHEQ